MHNQRLLDHGSPYGGRTPNGEALKYLTEVAIPYDSDECLTWPYTRNAKGYGLISMAGRPQMAHRIICQKVHGPPPSKAHQVGHSCGKGFDGCVNPKHLRWVTAKQNAQDRIEHGTQVRGDACSYAKLTEQQVIEIKSLIGTDSYRRIGERFGVGYQIIGNIARGERWRHIK